MGGYLLNNTKGVTLIEVLAAMLILSVVIFSFIGITEYTNHTSQRSNVKAEALQIAENKLNEVRNSIEPSHSIGSINSQELAGENGEFTVFVKDSIMENKTSDQYDYASVSTSETRVNLQAVVLLLNGTEPVARLLTVTVSWGG